MTLLDFLRAGSVLGWGSVVVRSARATWRLLRGRPGSDDVLWSIIAAFGAMSIAYNLRAYFAAGSTVIYAGLHIYSIALSGLTITVMSAYRDARRG